MTSTHSVPQVSQPLPESPVPKLDKYDTVNLIFGRMPPNLMALARERLRAGEWLRCLYTCEARDRLGLFLSFKRRMSDADYWKVLSEIWTDTECPNVYRKYWLSLFMSPRSRRDCLMSDEEHAALAILPDPIRIYRGAEPKYRRGISWTTEANRAAWFADRNMRPLGRTPNENRMVFTAVIQKRKVLAHFLDRDEAEIVIDPRRIQIQVLRSVDGETKAWAPKLGVLSPVMTP